MLRRIIGLLFIGLAAWFLVLPGVRVILGLLDSGARSGAMPRMAWSLHRVVTPQQEAWSKEWLATGGG
jgi:hypothetical protein